MDNLTHTFSGLVAARLYPARKLPLKTRYFVGVLAANAPDLDILLAPFSSELYLLHHRGITHSLLMLPILAWLLSWVFSRLFKASSDQWRDYYALTAIALLLHTFGDWITGYGTQLFAPLTNQTFSLGTTFILDPVFTLLLLLGYLGSVWKKHSLLPAQMAVLATAVWIGTQFYWKQEAVNAGKAHAAAQGWTGASVNAEPRPIAPFNWTVIIRENERYHYAHLNLYAHSRQSAPPDANWLSRSLSAFQPPTLANWTSVPQFGRGNDGALARDIWARPEFAFFRWFATAPALYRVEHRPQGACVWFEDLRFTAPGRNSPFRFGLCGPEWKVYRMDRDGEALPFH